MTDITVIFTINSNIYVRMYFDRFLLFIRALSMTQTLTHNGYNRNNS